MRPGWAKYKKGEEKSHINGYSSENGISECIIFRRTGRKAERERKETDNETHNAQKGHWM